MDEFNFDQNDSFVAASSDDFDDAMFSAAQRSKTKKKIDLVIHAGADDAIHHDTDNVLETLTNMVESASDIKNVETVSVCSLEEKDGTPARLYIKKLRPSTQNSHISVHQLEQHSSICVTGSKTLLTEKLTKRAYCIRSKELAT